MMNETWPAWAFIGARLRGRGDRAEQTATIDLVGTGRRNCRGVQPDDGEWVSYVVPEHLARDWEAEMPSTAQEAPRCPECGLARIGTMIFGDGAGGTVTRYACPDHHGWDGPSSPGAPPALTFGGRPAPAALQGLVDEAARSAIVLKTREQVEADVERDVLLGAPGCVELARSTARAVGDALAEIGRGVAAQKATR